jgi:hypothetical protein
MIVLGDSEGCVTICDRKFSLNKFQVFFYSNKFQVFCNSYTTSSASINCPVFFILGDLEGCNSMR